MTAHGARCRRGVCANFEMAVDQIIHSLFVLEDHDQVNALDADLQAPASAGDGEEPRSAPSAGVAACGHAFTAFGADYESAFYHVGNHRNALGMLHYLFGEAVVRCSHH